MNRGTGGAPKIARAGRDLTDEEFAELWAKLDTDGNGTINLHEFLVGEQMLWDTMHKLEAAEVEMELSALVKSATSSPSRNPTSREPTADMSSPLSPQQHPRDDDADLKGFTSMKEWPRSLTVPDLATTAGSRSSPPSAPQGSGATPRAVGRGSASGEGWAPAGRGSLPLPPRRSRLRGPRWHAGSRAQRHRAGRVAGGAVAVDAAVAVAVDAVGSGLLLHGVRLRRARRTRHA